MRKKTNKTRNRKKKTKKWTLNKVSKFFEKNLAEES